MISVAMIGEWDDDEGVEALQRLVETCLRHVGNDTVPIAFFLLSFYDGAEFRADIEMLCRRIDGRLFKDVILTMILKILMRKSGMDWYEYFLNGRDIVDELIENYEEYCDF
ncbi:MAG TPA: hypothetical protein VLH56_04405 [Dissulfurispiraceae bacterium]|nr:hypothetical protein [Dissulfurispiraceae bacterium]